MPIWKRPIRPRYEIELVAHECGRDSRAFGVDMVAAHKWFNLAAVRGMEAAKNWRNQVATEMSSGQIAEAQRLAREWLKVFK